MRRRKYTLTNLDSTVAVNFDNKSYVISSMDLGNIDASLNSYQGAGQYGKTITSRSLGTRNISIEGHILADNAENMKSRKALLQKIITPTSDFWLVIDDTYKIRCTADSTLEYNKKWYRNNELLTSFSIDAVCANPFFETIEPQIANITGWIKDFHFPYCNPVGTKFTFGHRKESKIVDLRNESEVDTGMIISFKAISGTIVNPYLQNAETLEKLTLNNTIQSGETVVVNTTYGSKSVKNITTNSNWLTYFDLGGSWLQMPTGISSFKYGFDNSSTGTLECNVQYIPQLIEV